MSTMVDTAAAAIASPDIEPSEANASETAPSAITDLGTTAHPQASTWWDAPGTLRGINLRSWTVLELAATPGSLTVAELVDRLTATGLVANTRASKAISDALRWEVRRGRAVRLERGRYALGRLARTTRHRMRRRVAACRARARAATPMAPVPPTPLPHDADSVDGRGDLSLLLSEPVVAQTRNTSDTRSTAGGSAATGSARLAPP